MKLKEPYIKLETSNAARSALIIILLSAISKALGLFRESALAAYFGASYDSDAYKVAFDIPSFLLGIVGTSIAMTFVPVYTQYLKNKTEEQRKHFINNIFSIIFITALIITAAGAALAPLMVGLIAPGFKGEIYELTVALTRIMSLSIIFIAFTNLAGGYLQSHEKFTAQAIIGIPYNLIIIVSILLFFKYGIKAVVIGTIIAFASQFAVQLPSMIKSGFRFIPKLDFKEPGIKEIVILSTPIFINGIFAQLYMMVERILASNLIEGSISALDYANKVRGLVFNIFIASIITVIYPRLSFISDEPSEFKKAVIKGLRMVIIFAFPMAAGLFLLRQPIINVLFERGAFDSADSQMTSIALGCFSLSIIGTGVREMLSTAYYSLKDTKTPMINGIWSICINIVLNIALARFWGIGGIAAATSASSLVTGIMLMIDFRKKYGKADEGKLAAIAAKSAFSSLLMGFSVNLLYIHYTGTFRGAASIARISVLAAITAAGALIYVTTLYLTKVEEIHRLAKWIQKSLNKSK